MTLSADNRLPDRAAASREVDDDVIELTDRCARPACRGEFKRAAGRGRRREYCSDICRRLVDKELKQARAAVAHYERLLRQARIDEAAFGRSDEELIEPTVAEQQRARAAVAGAVSRARAVVEFVPDGDPRAVGELRALVAAISPLLDANEPAIARR